MSDSMNIYQKLARIRKPVEILQKNKSGYGYKYVTEDVILSKITGLMDKLGVSLIPNINKGSIVVSPYSYSKTKAMKDGTIYEEKVNEILVWCDMEWLWVNNENPEDRIVVPWAMVGQQTDASQAFGSGLSYASRYFMLKYFNCATSDDDPDSWRSAQREAETPADREIAERIIEQVHELVNNHLNANPDDKSDIVTIVKKYAKTNTGKASANYYDITDPITAGKLLEEIKSKYSSPTEIVAKEK